MGGASRTDTEEAPERGETFVGYHGTSSVSVAALGQGIMPETGRNFRGHAQLGEGFYVTPDYNMALYFAAIAVRQAGGVPVALEVYARNFEQMTKARVPRRLWWTLAADSSYITDFDYLIAPIDGFEPIRLLKFNPRAYRALIVR